MRRLGSTCVPLFTNVWLFSDERLLHVVFVWGAASCEIFQFLNRNESLCNVKKCSSCFCLNFGLILSSISSHGGAVRSGPLSQCCFSSPISLGSRSLVLSVCASYAEYKIIEFKIPNMDACKRPRGWERSQGQEGRQRTIICNGVRCIMHVLRCIVCGLRRIMQCIMRLGRCAVLWKSLAILHNPPA